jgi:hypothetical protein
VIDSHLAHYPLSQQGAVRNWLACGTVTSPLKDLERVIKPDGSPFGKRGRWILNYWAFDPDSAALKLRLYQQLPPFEWQPGARPALNSPAVSGRRWEYAGAEEDNVIDFSRFNFTPTLMQGWLFACLHVAEASTVQAELLTIGPARIWVNGVLQRHYAEHFSYVALQTAPITLTLSPGLNDVYLHGEMLGWREARLALGLRFLSNHPPITVCLPLGDTAAEAWQRAEAGLSHLQVRQFAFPKLPGYLTLDPAAAEPFTFIAEVHLPIPEDVPAEPLILPEGRARLSLAPSQSGELPITPEVARTMAGLPGENTLSLSLRPAESIPLVMRRDIWASANAFSFQPYGDYDSRRQEALEHLAQMPFDVPAAMAAVAAGRAKFIASEAVRLACHFMNNRQDCADFYAVGLLALLFRCGDDPALRAADRALIEDTFRSFKFWLDEPGLDAMCYFTENHQILFHVSAYLAGQRWPEWVFQNSGRSGLQQKMRARPRIESWILRRLQGSFSEWDSNAYLTLDAFAMLALAEFADSPRLREMATALLHKIFFIIACQSFRGAHGSTHGRCYVTGLKSARVENTSNLQRIAWGMGIFNGETRAAGLLAMAQRYRVPDVIQHIGADLPPLLVTRARSSASFRPQFDMKGGVWDVRTMTRRTPDYMLSAAIDYNPGEMGIQEHLWQAAFGPEAVVFTTYPGNSQEHGHARPNFWAGSARLPRVAMFGKTVICLYRIEANVGLGFSHAYFPTAMFDEVDVSGEWAFARKGEGYAALCGDGELVLTNTGRHAGQELRSTGMGQVWLCHVGCAAEDGDFNAFRHRVREHTPQMRETGVVWVTPENQRLAFSWDQPLLVDGEAQDWNDFPHYENDYTQTPMGAETMTIRHGEQTLVLDLKRGRVVSG